MQSNPSRVSLVLMACSGLKQDVPAPAMDLYRGVMYQTYRANVKPHAQPHVVILSARHGFIDPQGVIAPYDQRMTGTRADEILAQLEAGCVLNATWPAALGSVLLAGGAQYRRVMRAALQWLSNHRGIAPTSIAETHGGIGHQRSQLGAFLRGLPA